MPPFVAHRGDPFTFPENTLRGALSAINKGTRLFEIDVQLTADLVPVLYHDSDLRRLSAARGDICATELAQLQRHGAFHPERFGQQHRGTPATTLQQLLSRLDSDSARVFVELKLESLQHFGRAIVLDEILPIIEKHRDGVAAVISKDADALELSRDRIGCEIGWVLPAWDSKHEKRATQFAPDFIFCNQHRLPATSADRWAGSWKWVIYTVNEPSVAMRLLDNGIDLIETDFIGPMLKAWRETTDGNDVDDSTEHAHA